ncbi:hypothetical protein BASA81_012883 [Batrachochytrium salamandrivorans]|nr:hypothetical protein BASA81_012883 [Batrachochytrium salamandrivorans]
MIGLRKKKEEEAAAAAAAASPAAPEAMEVIIAEEEPVAAPASKGRGRGSAVSIYGVKKEGTAAKSSTARRMKPGEIRVQKDVSELDGGECVETVFPDPSDLMKFFVTITPNEGYWAGHSYTFSFQVPDMYPHDPPKVHCKDKIYHPNVDLEGNVCLNILRGEWKPVLDLNAVIYGLIVLFHSPNPEDPLNGDAAKTLRENPTKFKQNVDRSLRGMDVDGVTFPAAKKKN